MHPRADSLSPSDDKRSICFSGPPERERRGGPGLQDPWLWPGWQADAQTLAGQSVCAALGPSFLGAPGSGSWNSQDTDVPATLGSRPARLPSLIPIFGCRSHLIHIPMSTLHNLPQTPTAPELGKGRGQLMRGGGETKGRGEEGAGSRKPPGAPSRQAALHRTPRWASRTHEPLGETRLWPQRHPASTLYSQGHELCPKLRPLVLREGAAEPALQSGWAVWEGGSCGRCGKESPPQTGH